MILDESQEERDIELADLLNVSIGEVLSHRISFESAKLYNSIFFIPTKEEIENKYRTYNPSDFVGLARTLMYTSIYGRDKRIIDLIEKCKDKRCLDFGSGVGTHAIALSESGNEVSILDIEGDMLDFSIKRLNKRNLSFTLYKNTDILPNKYFDVVFCVDVIEHLYDPLQAVRKITASLQDGGILCIDIGTTDRALGHYEFIQNKIRTEVLPFLDTYYTKVSDVFYVKQKTCNWQISDDCHIHHSVKLGYIETDGWIQVGGNVTIRDNVILRPQGNTITIDDNSIVNYNCIFHGIGKIWIGKNAIISPYCQFYAQNHGMAKDLLIMNQKNIGEDIWLGGDNWIGANTIVTGGTTIGYGAVVGAGSVVTKDIPEYEIWAGNICRKIGERS